MIVYTLEQRWEVGLRSTYRRCRFWQIKSSFQMKLILILADMKTSKFVAFGAQKTHMHTLKCRCTQNESLFDANVERIFVYNTFGFNRTALRATQPKLHATFCALSPAELMSFGHLRALI